MANQNYIDEKRKKSTVIGHIKRSQAMAIEREEFGKICRLCNELKSVDNFCKKK